MAAKLRTGAWIVGGVLLVLAAATFVLMRSSAAAVPPTSPAPALSYAEARKRVEAIKARDDSSVMHPTIFLDQGSRVATSVVIFHGFTNNPEQFERVGEAFYEAGYNVLIPRLPEHGERDLMTRDLSKVTAARLVEAADEAVDAAAGLGDRVEVVGLSGGGNLAARTASDRNEVASAVIISPLFGVDLMPSTLVRPIVGWSNVLPDFYLWWDPRLKEDHVPPDAYPRYSLKSISAFFEVGFDLMRREPKRTSELERVVLITNAADSSVDEQAAKDIVKKELTPHATETLEYEFPKANGYAHDIIDPEGMNAKNVDAIYARLWPYLGLEQD